MNRVKDLARIRFNLALVGFFSVAFLVTAIQGKRASRRGESVHKTNIDWHKAYEDPTNVEKQLPDIRRPTN